VTDRVPRLWRTTNAATVRVRRDPRVPRRQPADYTGDSHHYDPVGNSSEAYKKSSAVEIVEKCVNDVDGVDPTRNDLLNNVPYGNGIFAHIFYLFHLLRNWSSQHCIQILD
jgi:hypothetical protein